MATRPWPGVPEEHRWVIDLMEERFERTSQSPDELIARAEELRREAAQTEFQGIRDAAIA
jgi:hypothetical protein